MVEASAAASGSTEYTSDKLTAEQAKELEALNVWQVASKNALLKAKADETLKPQPEAEAVKITGSHEEYLANLRNLEKTLEKRTHATAEIVKFEDDVKTLRSLRAIGPDAYKSVNVIRDWK
jgi:precorrin-6B methylase 2